MRVSPARLSPGFLPVAVLAALAILLGPRTSLGGTLQDAKVALHARSPVAKGICSLGKPTVPCSQYVTSAPVGVGQHVYLVAVADLEFSGFLGLSCGIDYDAAAWSGVEISNWTLCADGLEFRNAGPNGDWPAAGGGNTITWVTCQSTKIPPDGVHAVAGAFYLYAYNADALRVTPNMNLQSGPSLTVADCQGAQTELQTSVGGFISFSPGAATPGFNPCVGGPGICEVSPTHLDFGVLPPGSFADREFMVSNVAAPNGGALAVTLQESCADFEVIGGETFFSLAPGESRTVGVRFTSSGLVPVSCQLALGGPCGAVELVGNQAGDIELGGEEHILSTMNFYSTHAVTFHSLALEVPVGPQADLHVTARGNLDSPAPRVTVSAEGQFLGNLYGISGYPCLDLSDQFGLSGTLLSELAQDQIIEIQLVNDIGVNPVCPQNQHIVELVYSVEPGSIDFGAQFTGETRTSGIRVRNTGGGVLGVTSVGVEGSGFTASEPPFALGSGESKVVHVHFIPSGPGPYAGSLTIQSDDPDEPSVAVALSGMALVPPVAELLPSQLLFALFSGESETQTATLTNTGGSDLHFEISDESPPPPPPPPPGAPRVALHVKAPAAKSVLTCVPAQSGGEAPTNIPCSQYVTHGDLNRGHNIYLTVNTPSTTVSGLSCGIEYNAYPGQGLDFVDWMLCADGLEFRNAGPNGEWPASGGGIRITWQLPSSCQANVISPDGIHAIAGSFYVYAYGPDQFRVTPNMNLLSGPELIMVDCDGFTVPIPEAAAAFAGFSNDASEPGFNPCAAESSSASLASEVPSWLSASPLEGTVPPGESASLAVTADAEGLFGGTYGSTLSIRTDDPLAQELGLPITLQVTGIPDISLSRNTIDFGPVEMIRGRVETLMVANAGTDRLELTGITFDHPDFSVTPITLSLNPGQANLVWVSFFPTQPGPVFAAMTLFSNDPDEPTIQVGLSGVGLRPADFSVSPESMSETLEVGQSSTQTFLIKNSGGVDLDWSVKVLESETAMPQVRPVPGGGGEWPGPTAGEESPEGMDGESFAAGRSPLRAYDPWPVTSSVAGGGFSILIVHSGNPSEIRSYLLGFPDIGTVDLWDGLQATPGLSDLQDYDAVLVAPNFIFPNPVGLGDVLADYADLGRGLILTTPAMMAPYAPTGRLLAGGYIPVNMAFGPVGSASLGAFDPNHPIMAGVQSLAGDILLSMTPVAGATLVASWNNGLPFVVARNNVVAVNAFVGQSGYWSGDLPIVLHNAALWASGGSGWLHLSHQQGRVPPGSSVIVSVEFDASRLVDGNYRADLSIETNDPDEPEVAIPVALHAVGRPHIEVAGESIEQESIRDYTTTGAVTQHSLVLPDVPSGSGSVALIADGDYGVALETATLYFEGTQLGSVGGVATDCAPATGLFPVSEALLSGAAADGIVEIEVRNSFDVNEFCLLNRHTVRLEYSRAASEIAFPSVFLGNYADAVLRVRNRGSAVLLVNSITTSHGEFAADASAFEILPGETRILGVRFTPTAAGDVTGTLSLTSNDPEQPQIQIALSGTGTPPPDIAVSPASLEESLLSGSVSVRELRIDNTGGGNLEFNVQLSIAPELSEPAASGRQETRVEAGPAARRGGSDRPMPPERAGTSVLLPRMSAALSPESVVFHDDMEDGSGGWLVKSVAQDPLWHRSQLSSNSPTTSWWCGIQGGINYNTGRTIVTTLVSPGIDLTRTQAPITLQFFESYETESGWDFCMVDVSVDGGKSWVPLRGIPGSAPSGSSGGWILTQLDLSAYAGQFLRFRYHFDTLDSVANDYPGWFIDDVAIIAANPDFVSVDPTGGTVLPGGSLAAAVTFDATDLLGGSYHAVIDVLSNDPDESQIPVPVLLQVVGIPDIALSASSLDFGTVFLGEASPRGLVVTNSGTEMLQVQSVTLSGAAFAADPSGFSLLPEESRVLEALFQPTSPGEFLGELILHSDDPDEPALTVSLRGLGSPPPLGNLSPEILVAELLGNQVLTQPAVVANDGESDLIFSAELIQASLALPSASGPKIAVHVKTPSAKAPVCVPAENGGGAPTNIPCEQYLARGDVGVVYNVYVMVASGVEGIRGVTCGVDYDATPGSGVDVSGWISCADLEFRNAGPNGEWPAAGGGNIVTWVDCNQRTVPGYENEGIHTLVGAFQVYAYGSDRLEITENRNLLTGPKLVVAGCNLAEIQVDPAAAGQASFSPDGVLPGVNPCFGGGSQAEVYDSLDLEKGEADPRAGEPVVEKRGGPDPFGYTWIDSDDPSGPLFDWEDVRDSGTAVAISGDDVASAPIPLGFVFRYYDVSYSQVIVTSNGYLTFLSSAVQFNNQPLPNPTAPPSLLAVFWDDLLLNPGQVIQHSDGSRFVLLFDRVRGINGDGPYTFQVILRPDGSITYQYLEMVGTVTGATVGMQDPSATQGLLVAFNAPYIHDALAVRLGRRPLWASVTPARGIVSSGASVSLDLTTDARGRPGGTYEAVLNVQSNDPDRPFLSTPVLMSVTPVPDITVTPAALEFGSVYLGGASERMFQVTNVGFQSLHVTGFISSSPAFSSGTPPFTLGPGLSRQVSVQFLPTSLGNHTASLTIQSDDPDAPEITIALTGEAIAAPEIAVDPSAVTAALQTGERSLGALTLRNTGLGVLNFEVSLRSVEVGGGTASDGGPGLPPTEVRGVGRPVPLGDMSASIGSTVATTVEIGAEDLPRKAEARPTVAGPGIEEVATGVEVFGSRQNSFLAGPRIRGNLFYCSTRTTLVEHRFYLNPLESTQLWLLVYEGLSQIGTYKLVSASDASPAGPGEGWYGSGEVDLDLQAGRYYVIVASFQGLATYYNELGMQPYPIPASFGELQAGVGWTWAPPTDFPPAPEMIVPGEAFGDAVAYYQTLVTREGVSWLSVVPETGTVSPGGESTVRLRFDASGLAGGTYEAELTVGSDDPDQASIVVPVRLEVAAAPDLAAEPSGLGLGPVYLGYSEQGTVTVRNVGFEPLEVTPSVQAPLDFLADSTPFTLAPSETRSVEVTFSPSGVGERFGSLVLQSNDPDTPMTLVELSGAGVAAPDLTVAPEALQSVVTSGQSAVEHLLLGNSGASDLKVSLDVFHGASPGATVWPALEETPRRVGVRDRPPQGPETAGPPVEAAKEPSLSPAAGLPFFDDFEDGDFLGWQSGGGSGTKVVTEETAAAGTRFSYTESNSPGGHFLGIYQDFDAAQPGNVSFYVRSGSTTTHDGYCVLLDSQGFEVIWFFAYGTGYFYVNADVGGNESVPYQALTWYQIEFRNIDFTAKNFDYYVNGALIQENIPFRNASAVSDIDRMQIYNFSPGSQAWWDQILVYDQVTPWLSVDPLGGVLAPGNDLDITVQLDATNLPGGTYPASIRIESNDPDESLFSVPVTLEVKGTPVLAVAPAELDFGGVIIGTSAERSVLVRNDGTGPLEMTAITAAPAEFHVDVDPFTVLPGLSTTLQVSFNPTEAKAIAGMLNLTGNDAVHPVLSVPLLGTGLVAPDVTVSPSSLSQELVAGEVAVENLILGNVGGSDLQVTISSEPGTLAQGSILTELSADGVIVEGQRVSLKELQLGGGATIPATVEISGYATDPDRERNLTAYGGNPSAPSEVAAGLEVFGAPQFQFFSGYVIRGNLFHATSATRLQEHWFYMDLDSSVPVWFLVYEGLSQVGTYQLVSASNAGLAGPGVGWYSSGAIDLDLQAGRYYAVVASVGGSCSYFNQQAISPYPVPASFGELQVGIGWDWAPPHVLPPEGQLDVPGYAFGAPVAYYQTLVTETGVRWLSMNPAEGTVPPGVPLTVRVRFDAEGLNPGVHDARLHVTTNDPDETDILIPVSLRVIEAPRIAFLPSEMDFGSVTLGQSETGMLHVVNTGSASLTTSGVTPGLADYSVAPSSFSVAPLDTAELSVSFTPQEEGERKTDLVFSTNVLEGAQRVPVSGSGVPPPFFTVVPAVLEAVAFPGGATVRSLSLCNVGTRPLELALGTRPAVFQGPDGFGHIAFDSDAPAGALFDWVDLSTTGSPIFEGYADDVNAGPFLIGFPFPYFGETFESFRVCSNGWISFTNPQTNFHNQPVPRAESTVPENLLAVLWDDLVFDPGMGSRVSYGMDGSRLVIEFADMCRFAGGAMELFSFEVILHPNGDVIYQYLRLGDATHATVGYQDGGRSDGLLMAHDTEYLHEGLAIKFTVPPDWIEFSPATLSLGVGECSQVDVQIDASAFGTSLKTATFSVTSMPPEPPGFEGHVLLHVGSTEAQLEVRPDPLNTNSQGSWVSAVLEFPSGVGPGEVVLESVRAQWAVSADPGLFQIGDANQNGVPDLEIQFDRGALIAALPPEDLVNLVVTGEIRNRSMFLGSDEVQVHRPHLSRPNGGERVGVGAQVDVEWDVPASWSPTASRILASTDGGGSWTQVGAASGYGPYRWTVPNQPTDHARLRIQVLDGVGLLGTDESDTEFSIVEQVSGTAGEGTPERFALLQNVPNPFTSRTEIGFELPVESRTSLRIFDLNGRVVAVLEEGTLPQGRHRAVWDGKDVAGRALPSGVYFYRMEAGEYLETRRLFLLR